jgi:hypothetical protein
MKITLDTMRDSGPLIKLSPGNFVDATFAPILVEGFSFSGPLILLDGAYVPYANAPGAIKNAVNNLVNKRALIRVGDSHIRPGHDVYTVGRIYSHALDYYDYFIPPGVTDKTFMFSRRSRAFIFMEEELKKVYEADVANFENELKKKPELIIDGVSPGVPLRYTKAHFEKTIEQIKAHLDSGLKFWLQVFKGTAEAEGRAGRQAGVDREVARANQVEAFGNAVVTWARDVYTPMYQRLAEGSLAQSKAYQQAKDDRESLKLLEEAKKAREQAEALAAQAKALEAQNKPVQAQAAIQVATQLTKVADQKEALADNKMPKSKTGIVLALAAAGALILASQE